MADKLGVIVPLRNRHEHLAEFKQAIIEYLTEKGYNFELIIVEQDDAKLFNRGMLLNIGFKYAQRAGCNYVVFHDVDMIPLVVDYSYSPNPVHLATGFLDNREIFDDYFGGVTLFPVKDFIKIDGYSNKYWGWGYEDDDLLFRCKEKLLSLDKLQIKNLRKKGKSLKFNGVNSAVKCKNVIDFTSSFSLFISFYPDELELDHKKDSDEFAVFSIPGYDFAICYTSFRRYNFCAFDSQVNALYINSNIKTNYKTNIVVSLDANDKIFKVYQDGKFIGQTEPFKRLYKYRTEPYFYLGVGKPDRELIPNYFKGYIDSFAYYDTLLTDHEVLEIATTVEDFRKLNSGHALKTYYSANNILEYKLKDLSKNGNDGEILGCDIVDSNFDEYTEITVPYRRKSMFKSLKHEENGFLGNKWKDPSTRWNQLRFQNEVYRHVSLINRDGLSTLKYVVHGTVKSNKVTHVNIGI